MNRLERTIVLVALCNMALYIGTMVVVGILSATNPAPPGSELFAWAIFAVFLNYTAMIVTIRDLYLRSFNNPNDKLTWLLLMMLTGGIGWFVYLWRYAFRPRPSVPSTTCERSRE